ncbi:MAG: hypothetical protein ACOVQX_06420 [Legionella sp.]
MYRQFLLLLILIWPVVTIAYDTELRLYRPYTLSDKQPRLEIIERVAGECWLQSQIVVREDAWQCKHAEKIYDPCFINPYASAFKLICPNSPWSNSAIELTTRLPLISNSNDSLDMSTHLPWAVELIDKTTCKAVEQSASPQKKDVLYSCDDGSVLTGHLQRCSANWKILQSKEDTLSVVGIRQAWF